MRKIDHKIFLVTRIISNTNNSAAMLHTFSLSFSISCIEIIRILVKLSLHNSLLTFISAYQHFMFYKATNNMYMHDRISWSFHTHFLVPRGAEFRLDQKQGN